MAEDDLKITIGGVEYNRLEDVPQQYRPMIEQQLASARTAADAASAASGAGVKKHFSFKINVNIKHADTPGMTAEGAQQAIGPRGIEPGVIVAVVCALIGMLAAWWARHPH